MSFKAAHLPAGLTALLLGIILGGCAIGGASRTGEPLVTPIETLDAIPSMRTITFPPSSTPLPGEHPSEIPQSTPQLEIPARTVYTLTAELDYDRHYLTVAERVSYINPASNALEELLFVVEPLRYPGTFQLSSLAWSDGQPITDFTWDETILHIPLKIPLYPGDRVELCLNYELNLPSPTPSPYTRPVPFGYTARQANLVDWYPFIPPHKSGQGWLVHPPGFFGEHLVYEMSDFRVHLRLAGAQPGLTIAASSPARMDGEGYHYQVDAARNFAWSVSHEYQVISQTVGSVSVWSYFFPPHATAGTAVLSTTAQALALYQELFGPYPRSLLSAVEADFLDGMEYDGLFFLSNGFYNIYQGTPAEYLPTIAAHETAHQWWYARVGNDQAEEPWLDEALSTYAERLYFENYYPDSLQWWWNYRINYYEPQGWLDGNIYSYSYTTDAYRAYRDAVYLNGALFLEELRSLMGDDAFFSFLEDYSSRMAGQLATGDDFFAILRGHSKVDLDPVLKKYFNNR